MALLEVSTDHRHDQFQALFSIYLDHGTMLVLLGFSFSSYIHFRIRQSLFYGVEWDNCWQSDYNFCMLVDEAPVSRDRR